MRPRATILGATLLASFCYFYTGGGWNQASRFDLVRAVVEKGTLRIDDYHTNTGDKAFRNGHYYCDKVPGAAFMALPFIAATRALIIAVGSDPTTRTNLTWLSYVATLAAAALPTAVAALMLAWVVRRLGATEAAGALTALAYGLGTPAWAYASFFWGHALSSACLVGAFVAAVVLGRAGSARRDALLGAVVGLTAGWATISELPAAVAAVALAGLAVAQSGSRARLLRIGSGVVSGAAVTAAVLGTYNAAAFGSPFHLSYGNLVGFTGINRGFWGLSPPPPEILYEVLFGAKRGLVRFAPILAVAPIGLAFWLRDPATRQPAAVASGLFLYFYFFNAAFVYWDGGWSYGPRFLASGIPFLAVGIAPVWARARRAGRVIILVLLVYSVGHTVMAVAVNPMPSDRIARPVSELLWPAFREGRLSLNSEPYVDRGRSQSWNWGERLGLHGLASLAPLLAIWIVAGAAAVASYRRRRTTSAPMPPVPAG